VNYPNNPLGITSTPDYVEELAGVIKKHKLFVLSDEVYEALTFQGLTHYSPAQHPDLQDRTLVLNSLSKTYAMTGWRVGYIVGNTEIMEKMFRLQESVISCMPVFIQRAAVAALKGPQEVVGMMCGEYEKRMNILVDGLNEVRGFHGMKTEGGLCVMFNISSFGKKSLDFAMELLEKARVMSVPGSAFGETGEGFVRFCFANSADKIREGVKRIKTYIEESYG
jgi:aminotransferase